MGEGLPRPVAITVMCDERLRLITEERTEECVVPEGAAFRFFLYSVFDSHPRTREKYPPGVPGFTLNGESPERDTVLQERGIIRLLVRPAR